MATLIELRDTASNAILTGRVESALIIAVQAILDGTPQLTDQQYAAYVFANTKSEGKKAVKSVLAKNNTATVVQILGASDATVQSNVDDVVTTLSAAYIASLTATSP